MEQIKPVMSLDNNKLQEIIRSKVVTQNDYKGVTNPVNLFLPVAQVYLNKIAQGKDISEEIAEAFFEEVKKTSLWKMKFASVEAKFIGDSEMNPPTIKIKVTFEVIEEAS